jgi:hypothetical protein
MSPGQNIMDYHDFAVFPTSDLYLSFLSSRVITPYGGPPVAALLFTLV